MEFRDKLLSSEMRHVTEMVNLLSCELVILQDFLLEMFGPRYSKFRRRHALAQEEGHVLSSCVSHDYESLESKSKATPTPGGGERKVNRGNNVLDKSMTAAVPRSRSDDNAPIDDDVQSCTSLSNGEQPQLDHERSDQPDAFAKTVLRPRRAEMTPNTELRMGGEADEERQFLGLEDIEEMEGEGAAEENDIDFDPSDSDSECNKGDMEWTGGGFSSRRGRSSSSIWDRFNCTALPGGKKVVTCRKCHENVSPVAKRLQKHYDRCVLGVNRSETSSGVTATSLSKKPKGEVWAHFERSANESGQVVVTCNYCSRKVSNHVTRMSKHLQRNCTKFLGMNESQA